MTDYYRPQRQYGLYQPHQAAPFRLSRSKIDLFLRCPKCFYLDRVLGVGQPPGYPFSLNSAVDKLLKKEFDAHRAAHTSHPLMQAYGLDAVPFEHEKMDEWRDSLRGGVTYLHEPTNLLITGGVDDLWVNPAGELIVVDYKATAKDSEVSLDADWQDGYKRQMEVYQWLLVHNGFTVSSTGYFVYCNGKMDREAFDGKLEFDVKLISYTGKTDWIEPTIEAIHACLNSTSVPEAGADCDFCRYRMAARKYDGAGTWNDQNDVLFERATALLVDQTMISTSFLQRKLEIGYARAARLMNQLKTAGQLQPSENRSLWRVTRDTGTHNVKLS